MVSLEGQGDEQYSKMESAIFLSLGSPNGALDLFNKQRLIQYKKRSLKIILSNSENCMNVCIIYCDYQMKKNT